MSLTILDKIVLHKRQEVADRKSTVAVSQLEQSSLFNRQTYSFREFVQRPDLTGIIAEYKRQSPSKGIINADATVEETTQGYVKAGASALSVLTDTEFFGGRTEDLIAARGVNACPIIRKDFVIDEYQILEAKAMGADAILLIAAILTQSEVETMAIFAHSLGLEVLLEVHNQEELERTLTPHVDLVGVNNRNLHDFTVSLETSKTLAKLIPDNFIKVSESGLSQPESLIELRNYGFQGFLMGEAFMRNRNPEKACSEFVDAVLKLQTQA